MLFNFRGLQRLRGNQVVPHNTSQAALVCFFDESLSSAFSQYQFRLKGNPDNDAGLDF